MRTRIPWLAAFLLVMSVAAPAQRVVAAQPVLEAAVASASREFGVPSSVILAVSWSESNWIDHGASPSYANGFGVMHLQDNIHNRSLLESAALISLPVDAVKRSLVQNVRAGTALLRSTYQQTYPADPGLSRASDLGRWYTPVTKYLRSDEPSAMRNYGDSVFNALARGVSRQFPGGITVRLEGAPGLQPQRGDLESVPNDFINAAWQRARVLSPGGARGKLASPNMSHTQFGADQWVGSPNYTSGRNGQSIIELVIHDCEGSFDGCVTTLQNPNNPTGNVSAHFVVRTSDGFRKQLVHVEDTAWHALSHNYYSVGIEHEGYAFANPTWYTPVMYRQSSWLAAWTCIGRFGCDRNHIVGHSEFDGNKSDPGPYWDWSYYMMCVNERVNFILYSMPPQYCY